MYKHWQTLSVTLTSSSSVDQETIVNELNSNSGFSDLFVATLELTNKSSNSRYVSIKQKKSKDRMRFYVVNTGLERLLKFNYLAGVADIPNYFYRHGVDQVLNYSDGVNILVPLYLEVTAINKNTTPTITIANHGLSATMEVIVKNSNSQTSVDGVDASIAVPSVNTITISGTGNTSSDALTGDYAEVYTPIDIAILKNARNNSGRLLELASPDGTTANLYSKMKKDYELLAGRSGLFIFRKRWVDGATIPNVVQVIEYSAGAKVGDLAKRITYVYATGDTDNDAPTEITETPHRLRAADLISPDWTQAN